METLEQRIADLTAKIEKHFAEEEATFKRLHMLEERMEKVEVQAAKVPFIEGRISRIERLILELQGEWRSENRHADDHRRRQDEKLDMIVAM